MHCPSCGHANPIGAKFCNECATAIAPRAPATSEGERRQLTVMFCDLVGSTALAGQMDAEDFREVVGAFQTSAGEVIARYGGHIGQYLGDGLLVYFGYPQAHEGDAERAVRAGLEIIGAVAHLNETLEPERGVRLAVRVGIHTGPVVVGKMGSRDRREMQALGATMNIAARLEGFAESNSVVVSDATLRLVPAMFVTKSLGTPTLKGVSEPIETHAVVEPTGIRSRLAVDPTHLTPMVGREEATRLLANSWDLARSGLGQAVLIGGEAGFGKSRVVYALRDLLVGDTHNWIECQSTPYTQGSAFYPVVQLIENVFGFQDSDDVETKLSRLERGLALTGEPLADTVPLFAPLLLLPLPERYPSRQENPALLRKMTIERLLAWVVSLAERQPLVMVVEDLHWCDSSTIEFLGLLLERSAHSRALTILTHRPEFTIPWSEDHPHLRHLEIGRLSRSDAIALVESVSADLSVSMKEIVVERADGVPLYLEELTKAIGETEENRATDRFRQHSKRLS